MSMLSFRPDESDLAVIESCSVELRAVMNSPDQDTIIRAVDDARSGKLQTTGAKTFMRFLAINALVCAPVLGLIAPAEAQSSLKKLRRCLEFKDMTMPRLICYDAIVPPRTKPKPGPAEVVNDCRFLKEDDERLICFNRFVENPAKPVAPENSAKPVVPEKSAKPVAPKARSAAPKPVEPRADNKDSFDLWWEWVVSRLIAR